jgi:hypothetical protein
VARTTTVEVGAGKTRASRLGARPATRDSSIVMNASLIQLHLATAHQVDRTSRRRRIGRR